MADTQSGWRGPASRSPASIGLKECSRARTGASGLPDVVFHLADVRQIALGQMFDAAILMFGVLSYQVEDEDVARTLRSARRHVRGGGLLVADVWYGPAVVHIQPEVRTKTIPFEAGVLERVASGVLDTARRRCEVTLRVREIRKEHVARETVEVHAMRFFFADEIEAFLRDAGFEVIRISAFPKVNRPPSVESWNALIVARAV